MAVTKKVEKLCSAVTIVEHLSFTSLGFINMLVLNVCSSKCSLKVLVCYNVYFRNSALNFSSKCKMCFPLQVTSPLWLHPAVSCTALLHAPVATTSWTVVGKASLRSQQTFQKPSLKCV